MEQSTETPISDLLTGILIVAATAAVLIAWWKGHKGNPDPDEPDADANSRLKLGIAIKTLAMSIGFIVLLLMAAYMLMRAMWVPALITAAITGIIGYKIKLKPIPMAQIQAK